MGFTATWRFVNRGVRRRPFRRFHRSPEHRWDMMKNMLDSLIRVGRVETTLAKAKEVQQYAEEIVHFAKKDTPEADKIVESMLRTPYARHKLYEVLVPRYEYRPFYVTRVFNQYRLRLRDSAPMAYIEFVDRPGEIRPANPVGFERKTYIWEEMKKNRANYRRYRAEALKKGLLYVDQNGDERLLECIEHLRPRSKYEWRESEDENRNYVPLSADKSKYPNFFNENAPIDADDDVLDKIKKKYGGKSAVIGPHRQMEDRFIDIPFGHERNISDRRLRKQYRP